LEASNIGRHHILLRNSRFLSHYYVRKMRDKSS
jgi:hypothetical protein